MSITTSEHIASKLIDAGVINPDGRLIRRIVIDLCAGEAAQIYVQYDGGDELAQLLPQMKFIKHEAPQ